MNNTNIYKVYNNNHSKKKYLYKNADPGVQYI